MLRYPERYDDRTAREMADKLEAEPDHDAVDTVAAILDEIASSAAGDEGSVPLDDRDCDQDAERIVRAVLEAEPAHEDTGLAEAMEQRLRERFPFILRDLPFATIAGAVAEVAGERVVATEAERDEAREALRGMIDAFSFASPKRRNDAVNVALAVLEGVERTHALVPVTVLERYADAAQEQARGTGEWRRKWQSLATAARAAARGERVDWPGVA